MIYTSIYIYTHVCLYIHIYTHIVIFPHFYIPNNRMRCPCLLHLYHRAWRPLPTVLGRASSLPPSRILQQGWTAVVLPLFSGAWNREITSLLRDLTDDNGGESGGTEWAADGHLTGGGGRLGPPLVPSERGKWQDSKPGTTTCSGFSFFPREEPEIRIS